MHTVILVPGLGDYNTGLSLIVKLWAKENINIQIHLAPWENKKEDLKKKLERLVKKIDVLSKNGHKVSLIGTSAGGSFVLNAFALKKDKIHKVITVSPRLLKGRRVFPTLSYAAQGYPVFEESVLACEAFIPSLTKKDKEKIMISQSVFDEIVPFATQQITGARTLKVYIPFHILSIGAAMTISRKTLINFILAN